MYFTLVLVVNLKHPYLEAQKEDKENSRVSSTRWAIRSDRVSQKYEHNAAGSLRVTVPSKMYESCCREVVKVLGTCALRHPTEPLRTF